MSRAEFGATRRILVRGASGFLGGALAASLQASGAHLRLFCRTPEQLLPQLQRAPVEIEAGDACDPAAVARSLRGVELVVDCIGTSVPATAPRDLLPEVDRHLRSMAVLLDAMAEERGQRLLFVSSAGALFDTAAEAFHGEEIPPTPTTAYGVGKWLAEEMIRFRVRRGELASLIVRPANVYGRERPGARPQGVIDISIDRALRGLALERWGDGSAVRDYLYIDDFVAAIGALLALPDAAGEFHVGSGVGSSLDEVLEAVAHATGVSAGVEYARGIDGGVRRSVVSSEKLRRQTGWMPRFALADGIAAAVLRQRARFEREAGQ